MGTPSQGAQSKLCMDLSAIGVSSQPLEFISETLSHSIGLIDHGAETTRGTRSHAKERVSQDVITVGGWIHLYPSPTELHYLLYLIFGTTVASNVFAVAETVPSFLVCLDRVAKVHTYSGCYINQAIFVTQKNKRLKLSLEIWGTTFSEGAAASFPSGVTPDLDTAYTHKMSTLTLHGSARDFSQAAIVVNNYLQREYNNSATAKITTRDRQILFACNAPYTADETALYTTPVSSSAGAAAQITWVNGGQSLTMDFANMKIYPASPHVPGKSEIRLPLKAKAYMSSTTREIITTSDAVA